MSCDVGGEYGGQSAFHAPPRLRHNSYHESALARGNITGMSCISSDLAPKRLQLLQEAIPGLSRVSVLYNSAVPAKVQELQDIETAAKTLEIAVLPVAIRDASELADETFGITIPPAIRIRADHVIE
ncbi:MAG TPA: ABC transporter substrate binding protein [Stellaceae bacterium]|nr:ABC transporter substrate binding protein [Stellaceae bacterium]